MPRLVRIEFIRTNRPPTDKYILLENCILFYQFEILLQGIFHKSGTTHISVMLAADNKTKEK
jgi:hypothetical protein